MTPTLDRPDTREGATVDRGLVGAVLAISVLVAVTIVVVLVLGDRGDADVEAGTPEAAVAAYLEAFDADDLATAHDQFSSEVRAGWDLDAYRRDVDAYRGEPRSDRGARRVIVSSVEVTGDAARVRLTVEEFSGEGLEGDVQRWEQEVRMLREDGRWTIDERLVWLDRAPSTLP